MRDLRLKGNWEKEKIYYNAMRVLPFLLLSVLTLLLLLLPLEKGEMFGSEGDWYSQHVGAAEALRQTMLSEHTIFPQFVGIGGGINAYDLAYYGLLRPDVLFSVLFPQIEMKHIISVYAIAEVTASVNLMYLWLKKKGLSTVFALAGAAIFAGASCFFHAHHQIMFVNYMPFLILGLLGIDRLIEKRKSGLLAVAVFLICQHSFFYAPVCIVVCLIYGLYSLWEKGTCAKEYAKLSVKGIVAAVLGVAMAAVLLLPTALTILSTQKDGGIFSKESLEAVDVTFESLLYQPYGCGMSMIALYCLFLTLTRKKKRVLAVIVCVILAVPAIWLVFSGFLYARAKILIPLVPLIVYLCVDVLQAVWRKEQKVYFLPFLFAVLAAYLLGTESRWQELVYVDAGLLFLGILALRHPNVPVRAKQSAVAILLMVPLCVSYGVNCTMEDYLAADDVRQERFTFGDITMFAEDTGYRFDYLANNYINSNVLPDGNMNKTASYSSVTNSLYSKFYYDIMKNPISLRNRVVLMPNQNSLFNYFMGIRYVLTEENRVPRGYEIVFRRNGFVLAENPDVLPVCYGTDTLLTEEKLESLEFPQNMAALCGVSVREENPRKFFSGDFPAEYDKENRGKVTVPLKEPLKDRILVVSFDVNRQSGREVCITINGMKNNLSGKNAPYPNGNHTFTFVLSADEAVRELEITMTKASYTLENLKVFTVDVPKVDTNHVWKAREKRENGKVFSGQVDMKEDGYFITSYPYKEGWDVTVDGISVKAERVNTAFTGFPLEKGRHSIEIVFKAPGFDTGIRISMTAFAALTALMIIEYLRERKREQ